MIGTCKFLKSKFTAKQNIFDLIRFKPFLSCGYSHLKTYDTKLNENLLRHFEEKQEKKKTERNRCS